MAIVNATTSWLTSGTPAFFYGIATTIPCPTTFANLGPLTTTFTPPAPCQNTSHYADLQAEGTRIWTPCQSPLEYKSCMPSSSLASQYYDTDSRPCGTVFTFHSPGFVCPVGWTTATEFQLSLSVNKASYDTSTVLSPSSVTRAIPSDKFPDWLGIHRLCCPSAWTFEADDSTYGCRSTGFTTFTDQASYCTTSCTYNFVFDRNCETSEWTPASIANASTSRPASTVTFGLPPVYMIAEVPKPTANASSNSMSRTQIAVTASFVSVGVIAMIIALKVMRRRHRRRKEAERASDPELPRYSRPRHVPLVIGTHAESCETNEIPPRSEARDARIGTVSFEGVNRGEADETSDLPPAYDSAEVWEGDGRLAGGPPAGTLRPLRHFRAQG